MPKRLESIFCLLFALPLCIAHLRDRRYIEISGGKRQLAFIARTLAQQPRVLLLEEPTSHLDLGNQMLILETFSSVTGLGQGSAG